MNAINQSGWKPEMNASDCGASETFTGNRALMLDEPLIFEIGDSSTTGVDFENLPLPLRGEGR
jgi:glycine dehydrogenase subunit 2